MQKDVLTELIDELTKLQDEQKKITIPVPATPKAVRAVIERVLRKHELNSEDVQAGLALRSAVAGLDSVTLDDVKLLKDMKAEEREKQ